MTAQLGRFGGSWKFLRFSVVHSLRDMWRNRSRTVFALICVATGVAAVVALQSLAFMIGDQLTTNLAQMNRGDIRVTASLAVPELITLSNQGNPVFTQDTVDQVNTWAKSAGVNVTVARLSGFAQIARITPGEVETSHAAQTLFIQPGLYPFYDTIILDEPAGVTLADLFAQYPNAAGTTADPRSLVISRNMTRQSSLGLHIGDIVRLGATQTEYIVRGIAPSNAETILSNPAAAFLGDYVYVPFADLSLLGDQPLPDQIFIEAPRGTDITALDKSLVNYLQAHVSGQANFAKALVRTTVPQLETQNAQTANVIDEMILAMGLSSLLIGGIGIINTMLVVVNRRTLEIAVLKTLGLKAYRVTTLFLMEALLMGLLGSLVGIAVGVALSYLIRGVGEQAFSLTLDWHVYPEAMLNGLFLGMVITALFGFLPTLVAGQVRPAVVLRPNEAQMPAAGLIQILFTLVVMITTLGLLTDTVIKGAVHYGPVYMIAGGGALVGLFAGVIIANTRLGKPIPAYYVFRLPRRFERLENWITGTAGALVGVLLFVRWHSSERRERGRAAITFGLRALRQVILLYGSVAIGAALASGIAVVLSAAWVPFGIGQVKPANNVVAAWNRGAWQWVALWNVLTLEIGLLIRLRARALVGVIALGALGASLGGGFGALAGLASESLMGSSGVWHSLATISTGVVLVEAALTLLCVVYVGYWLLIWVVGKIPVAVFMGIVGVIIMSLVLGAAAAVAQLGIGALAALVAGGVLVWAGMRFGVWKRLASSVGVAAVERGGSLPGPAQPTARGTSVMMLSLVALAGGLLLVDEFGARAVWAEVLIGVAALAGLWFYLRRRYAVDGRLVLRQISGRRTRVASTLLGLSVGIAGLSIVALTTGAVSHLLQFQLNQTAEGNLLIIDPTSQHTQDVLNVLRDADGVESFSQVTTYRAGLAEINGERVKPLQGLRGDQEGDQTQTSDSGPSDRGVFIGLTARESLQNLPNYSMQSGRSLRPGDEGHSVIMLRQSYITNQYNIKPGDRLLLTFRNGPGASDDVQVTYTVVGIISHTSQQTGLEALGNLSVVPPGALPDTIQPQESVTIAKVNESNGTYMDQVLVSLANVPGVVAFEVSALTQLIQNLLNQLKAIPTLVAWLALVAGTAIIANTVALATQERRRQIGVMKAVGLKGWRVLAMLMIENGLIGLIAGLIGVFVGLLITVIVVLASQNIGQLQNSIEFSTMGWLVFMAIVVAMGAAIFSAWSAAAEKPMNVLRYE
ncbi:MAG TPA: FtsX-like permease family protein [Aggregatilineaceae bacterium]|nr:FtsX-like permease family protein [Aggregatilineaceae bacterium]